MTRSIRAPFLVVAVLLPSLASAAQFVGGPSVRVTPNASVEIEWITDVAWFGRLEVFTTADGNLTPVLIKNCEDGGGNPLAEAHQLLTVPVTGIALQANTQYFFRITATDPTKVTPDLVTAAPLPPFFTGAQSLTNVQATSITTSSATVSWQGNVIGNGKIAYGTSSLDVTVQDDFNITDHALELAGLAPGTTYQFTVSNLHDIDGTELASQTGQFTTAPVTTTTTFNLTQPDAEPRVIRVAETSTVSVRVKSDGQPVPGALVGFMIDSSSDGAGSLSAVQANASADGVASVQFTASRRGLVKIIAFPSGGGGNAHAIPIVVR